MRTYSLWSKSSEGRGYCRVSRACDVRVGTDHPPCKARSYCSRTLLHRTCPGLRLQVPRNVCTRPVRHLLAPCMTMSYQLLHPEVRTRGTSRVIAHTVLALEHHSCSTDLTGVQSVRDECQNASIESEPGSINRNISHVYNASIDRRLPC